MIAEVAATVYDGIDAYQTRTDDNATTLEKGLTATGAIVGLVAAGGGDGTGLRNGGKLAAEVVSHTDEANVAKALALKSKKAPGKRAEACVHAKHDGDV